MQRSAFSLVELSIVLVILGLLTGGILAGQSLIRAAELRSLSADIQRFMAASNTFRDKYFAIPGDMTNATKFWGDNNSACPDAAIPNGTPGTCNGDGNGRLDHAAAASLPGENFTFWQQMALAGLIEGQYTGLAGAGTTYPGRHTIIGQNGPRARLSNVGYYIEFNSGGTFGAANTNLMMVGTTEASGSPTWGDFLKPEEAWNLDVKMDDGRPGTGKFLMSHTAIGGCVTTGVAATAEYQLNSSAIGCSIYLANFI